MMNISIFSRSTAMAVTLVAARMGAIVGNLVFGYLVESHCATPILMVAGLLFGEPPRITSLMINLVSLFQAEACWVFSCLIPQRNL